MDALMFIQYPHTCMSQTHVADGVNNSISFFPAEQIADGTDCSDRSVLSTVATLKINVGNWIQEFFFENY